MIQKPTKKSPFKAVGGGSETQLQVGENWNLMTKRLKG